MISLFNDKPDVIIKWKEVQQIIHKAGFEILRTAIADHEYRLLSDEEAQKRCRRSGVKEQVRRDQSREQGRWKKDCADYAHNLVNEFTGTGYLFGSCDGATDRGMHRWCWYINDKRQLKFIEIDTYKGVDVKFIYSFYTA